MDADFATMTALLLDPTLTLEEAAREAFVAVAVRDTLRRRAGREVRPVADGAMRCDPQGRPVLGA